MKFRIMIIASMSLLMVLWLVTPLCAQDVTQQIGAQGNVNWTTRVITATGIGEPGGRGGRAGQILVAKNDALRQMLATINGMYLDAETTIRDFTLESDVIKTRVEGVARNFWQVGEPDYKSDGSIEVTMAMALDDVTGVIIPEKFPNMGAGKPIIQPQPAPSPSQVYTGLIIDARGLEVRPAMAPKVVNEDMEEVYGSRYVSREYAIQQGMVGYGRDVDQLKTNDRVTDNPLVIKALRAEGPNKTDVVVANADANTLHSMDENLNFLKKCRVMLVVD
jgi:hypothetical protein